MLDRDGVYIENVLVAPPDGIATTYQGNDLTKPASQQANYSDAFDLPDSLAVRKLTKHAEQLHSGSRFPYVPLKAQVINNGKIIFEGIAELSSWSGGWEVALYQEKRALFDRLDRSLKTVNLDRFNHPWSLEGINSRAAATEGVCYPVVDYGLLQSGITPLDTTFPATFVKTIVAQALEEEGYTLVGNVLTDELYKRLIIAFSESEPTSHDRNWADDRFARVTLSIPDDSVTRGALGSGNFLDRIQPFSIDNIDTFYQGKLHPFNTTTHEYICPDSMNLKVEYSQIFKAQCIAGGIEVILSVEKNGNKVADKRMDFGAGYNLLYLRTDKISLTSTVKCNAGDRVRVRLEARRFTQLGAYKFEFYNNSENAFLSFTPDAATSFGDNWLVSRNLPEITVATLLINLGYLMGGTWQVNAQKRQVSFSAFSNIVSNTDNAIDWSNRLDTGTEVKWSPRLPPYAQVNYLSYAENTETKAAGHVLSGNKLLNYGDGVINVDAPVLDMDTTLFTMAFGASTDSAQELPGYGNPPLIKIRSVSGSGSNITINNQNTTPRLLLASLGDTLPVASSRLLDDGTTVEPVSLSLRPCWFGTRPYPLLKTDPAYSLSFETIRQGRGEIGLIDSRYTGLQRVLRRMRVLTVSMRLKPTDIANLDFEKPIRLQRVAVGGIVLSDGFYYLNIVSGYESGRTCPVTLVAF